MTPQHPHHRPQFHLSLPRGFLNDPNGPVELAGVLHLYFQSRSLADQAVPVEWGHATTTDLVRWRLHRPAMSPVPGGLDSDGCWSGNTVREGDRVRAYYSGRVQGRRLQHVLTALSDEHGAGFGAATTVVDDPDEAEGVRMFRDPFVWEAPDGWHLAMGCALADGRAAIRHYRSLDALSWEPDGNLAELPRTMVDGIDTGEGWECPQVVRVDGREVAVVCSWSIAGGPSSVLAFPLDGVPRPHRLDDGHDFYAPSVMRDGSFGSLLFGWVMEGREPSWWREEGWSGAISLPRRVWLSREESGADRLCTEPHPAADALRVGTARAAAGAAIGAQAEIAVAHTDGRVRLAFGDDEWLDIELDLERDIVTVDVDHASRDPRSRGGHAVARGAFDGASDRSALRIFIDGSVIEVFTSAGRSITTRAYPISQPPWHVEAPAGALVWDLESSVVSD